MLLNVAFFHGSNANMRCIIHHWGPVLFPFVSCRLRPKCASQLPIAPPLRAPPKARVKKSHRDKKAADRSFWGSWVSESRWFGFHMLNMLNAPTPQRKSGVFWGGIFWDVVLFFICFFCNLALELIWWIFLSEKMGLALLNMDFTEQMGICGVLDLEVEVFFIVFCWMSFFQWVSGLAGFGR